MRVSKIDPNRDANRRVLVVDNELHIRRLVATMLNRAGYEVRTVASAAEALSEVENWPPSLVVTDYAMDDGTGLDLCAGLHCRPETRDTAVILVTGFSDQLAGCELVDQLGVACVFEKPFSPSELVETVHAVIAGDWPRVPTPHLTFEGRKSRNTKPARSTPRKG